MDGALVRYHSSLLMAAAPAPVPALSIVVPVYNEEQSIDGLVSAIDAALRPTAMPYEVVFVDDGSTDGSLEKLQRHAAGDPSIRVFAFRRNLGKSPALTCGFRMARGAYVATLDADLQDDPADIPRMLDCLKQNRVGMVNGWRRDRQDGAIKVLSSKIFNLVVRLLFGLSFRDMNSGLKVYQGAVTRDLRLYGGMHRFIPLIASELGYQVGEVPVRHDARRFGRSKYPSTKIFTEIPDLLTLFFLVKYTRRPLHFFGRVGSAMAFVGLVVLLYLTWLWLHGIGIGTRPLLSFGVLLVVVGFQIVLTGLLADLIVNVNQERYIEFPLKYSSDEESAVG
jgi:glycosyltransferase involved in cell wall biosynthesis